MNFEKQQQVENFLVESCRRANKFQDQNNQFLKEYWKGQVFGMIKIIKILGEEVDINTEFYLKQLP